MRLLLPPTSTTLAVAIATSNSVSLSWTLLSDFDFQTPDFDSYQIFRDTNSGVDTNDTPIATITSTSTLIFTDTNLSPNTTFFYKLFVFDKAGLSTESNEVSATTLSAVSRLGIKVSIP
ncbi:MAG: fibronectin type III domain-containing protein, partial [bacterium]|nr:fibronectin type III domain-containing protein [bacterium]